MEDSVRSARKALNLPRTGMQASTPDANDVILGGLIQESQGIQGFKLFDKQELLIAVRGWKKNLSDIPLEYVEIAFSLALKNYEEGRFNSASVKRAYRSLRRTGDLPAPGVRDVEQLARMTLADPPSQARSNILGPIADWIAERQAPRRQWEKEVLDAVKGDMRNDHCRGVAADESEKQVRESPDEGFRFEEGS